MCVCVYKYIRTVYMRYSHCLLSMVKFWLVTVSWRNSHSPWVLITSRENWVARDELENGKTRISSTEETGRKSEWKDLVAGMRFRPFCPEPHSRSLTAVHRRADGDVASLYVEGELVDVHFASADHLHFLFGRDRPVVGHVHVRILRGFILLCPETQTHFTLQNLFMLRL